MNLLKKIGILVFLPVMLWGCRKNGVALHENFENTEDRVWIGETYWSVPMEDWRIQQHRLEFTGKMKNARVHLLTHPLSDQLSAFRLSADVGKMQDTLATNSGTVGFSIGVKDNLDSSVQAACYYGKGMDVGVSTQGYMFIGKNKKEIGSGFDFLKFNIEVIGQPAEGGYKVEMNIKDGHGHQDNLSFLMAENPEGLVSIVNNIEEENGIPFWFDNISLAGEKVDYRPTNSFGPVLWTMYTLSKGIMKLSAQMPPISVKDNPFIELWIEDQGAWKFQKKERIDSLAYQAVFKIINWPTHQDVNYKLIYHNKGKEFAYPGRVRKEPINRPLTVGGLTCQHWGGYPYSPLVKNIGKHDPDLLYFSGDQLYEENGGYPIKRSPDKKAILSYLGKWYMFGWSFRSLMGDRPTICTPDDHDVFHGNLWGEGGKRVSEKEWNKRKDAQGGFVQSPTMINVVYKTQCAHLPDPYEPTPLYTGINVWFTDISYGKVNFAIISDRIFKSGPEMALGDKEGRIDHVNEPHPNPKLSRPGLDMLGERQLKFMEHWIEDWSGVNMKVLLTQTVLANVATHHGQRDGFLYGDMDSGGWPKSPRDRAVDIMRRGYAFHINGDQHLPFVIQYGLKGCRDAGWAFCTPAISTGYPRWFLPDELGYKVANRPAHRLSNTGCYQDIFGNSNYIYAVGNPADDFSAKDRYERAQKKSSGFGLITFDTEERTIQMDAYRFLSDKDKPSPNDHFPGWPVTISQFDNEGRIPLAYLPRIHTDKPNQVVKVFSDHGELIHAVRIKGFFYDPEVYRKGLYTVIIGEGSAIKKIEKVKPIEKKGSEKIQVNLVP